MQLKNKKRLSIIVGFLILLLLYLFSLPKPLLTDPTSTVLTDANDKLLAAQIADDGQWRFPPSDSVPYKFRQAIIHFEDEYFYYHPGINPVSLVRAIKQNIKAGKVVSGGSTITAQVIRLSRKGKPRNIWQKIIEFTMATRLELTYSKDDILNLYASHAPFGGNVVGLDAAAWRYYKRASHQLSWGEAATLAVLPNAPALIFPGKNHELLRQKRNRLLNKLRDNRIIDSTACELAKYEPLPDRPHPLPRIAPHLLTRVMNEGRQGQMIKTTIDAHLQKQANRIVEKHHRVLAENQIMNAAAVVLEVETGKTLAYVGNTNSPANDASNKVDIIPAPRSTGSTLKPFLFAWMQKEGMLLPKTLVADIPTQFAGYSPKNFDKTYHGAVAANNALARSLNIPAVRMLKEYGVERFHENLKTLGLSTITQPADHYGLSLILGGAETTLWELSGAYASMARVLNHYANQSGEYNTTDYHMPVFERPVPERKKKLVNYDLFSASAIWLTFNALTEMYRPTEGENWKVFSSSKKIAWKTGTSFGHRDAWAIGVTPEYVVGVWVGNADGEGRPGLTGANIAAPIMFELFKQLPKTGWFSIPYDDLITTKTCKISGYKAGKHCVDIDTTYACRAGERTLPCPYHKLVHLDATEKFQVNANCYPVKDMVTKTWFVLPPVMEWYYKNNIPFYESLPPFHPNCQATNKRQLQVIYPKSGTRIYLPVGFNQAQQKTVFEAVHQVPGTIVHWHIDEEYLGQTTNTHKMEVYTQPGKHQLILVDELGETRTVWFEVLER